MMDKILFISAAVIFWGYVLVCLCMFGIPSSLSDIYYLIKDRSRGEFKPYFFSIILWVTAFLLISPWINHVNNLNLEFVPFWGCAALCFVGAAPNFKNKGLEKRVHVDSAIMAAIAAYFYSLIDQHEYLTAACITALFAAFAALKWKCKTFFLEMGAFAIIFYLLFKQVF